MNQTAAGIRSPVTTSGRFARPLYSGENALEMSTLGAILKAESLLPSDEGDEKVFIKGILRGDLASLTARPYELSAVEYRPDPHEHKEPSEHDGPLTELTESQVSSLLAAQRARLEKEWAQKVETAVEAAKDEAFEAGLNEGLNRARSEAEAQLAEIKQGIRTDIDRVERLWQELIARSEPALVHLAIFLVEAILDGPSGPMIKDAASRAIARAVEELSGASPILISLHPADYLRLQETGIADQLIATHEQLRWNTDPELVPGDWSVESPFALIRSQREELIQTFLNHLGLNDQPDAEASKDSAIALL